MGRRTGTGEELDSWRLLLTAAEERCESSAFDGRWRGGSVEEKSVSPRPGAPDVNGDLSRHGEARRLRRSPWSRSIDGVNNRRHFSLWTRREECQSSRDKHNTHASSRSPPPPHSSTKVKPSTNFANTRTDTFRCRRIITMENDGEKKW